MNRHLSQRLAEKLGEFSASSAHAASTMRDILLSGTAGFLFSCAGGFMVHKALWRAADVHAQELDAIAGNSDASASSMTSRRQTESFESYIGRRAAHWWNSGVDNVHARLVGLPETMDRIVDDAKSLGKSKPSEEAE